MVKVDLMRIGNYEADKHFMSFLYKPPSGLLTNPVVAPGVSSPSLVVHLGD